MMLAQAKRRAKQHGRDFDLTLNDIKCLVVPVCPVLGIPIRWEYSHGSSSDNSPSLDRVDNSKGYVKGNVAIISTKANTLKKHLTLQEAEAILGYITEPQKESSCSDCDNFRAARKSMKITEELEQQILSLRQQGATYRDIEQALGVSKSNACYVVNRARHCRP